MLLVTALDVEPGRVLSQLAAAQPLEQFIGAKQQETGDPVRDKRGERTEQRHAAAWPRSHNTSV